MAAGDRKHPARYRRDPAPAQAPGWPWIILAAAAITGLFFGYPHLLAYVATPV